MNQATDKIFPVYKKDGIIYCIYLKTDLIIDTDIVKQIIKKRIELSQDKPHPILIDARGVKYWTLESRKYSLSKEAHQYVRVYGVVINSSIIRTIVNWAVKLYPLPVPQKFFSNKEEALNWLNQFKDKEEEKPSKPILVF